MEKGKGPAGVSSGEAPKLLRVFLKTGSVYRAGGRRPVDFLVTVPSAASPVRGVAGRMGKTTRGKTVSNSFRRVTVKGHYETSAGRTTAEGWVACRTGCEALAGAGKAGEEGGRR